MLRQPVKVMLVVLLLAVCDAASGAVTVLPGGSTVAGKTIGQWTEDWWNWALSFGPGPLSDPNGARATVNQSGPVFFVGGTTGGPAVARAFDIPANKFVLFPLANFLVANGADPGFAGTQAEASQVTTDTLNPANLFATLDGGAVANLASHREASPSLFSLTGAPNNDLGFPPGTYADAASDGYWLMLAPLAPGPHTLDFGGVSTAHDYGPNSIGVVASFSVNVADAVQAVPLPAGAWAGLVLRGMLASGAAACRRPIAA